MQSNKVKETIGITALYCRLSRDDGKECESNSISNQKKMLKQKAKEYGFQNVKYYVDDGYTGTNFNRPGFQALIDDIEMLGRCRSQTGGAPCDGGTERKDRDNHEQQHRKVPEFNHLSAEAPSSCPGRRLSSEELLPP